MKIGQLLTAMISTLAMLVPAGSALQAQCEPTQTMTVGLVFVDFADADNDIKQRGGVGFTARDQNGNRAIDPDKFTWTPWWNFFFQETGQVDHPDDGSHGDDWPGLWSLNYLGSLRNWCTENSSGRHLVQPFSTTERSWSGILNEIVDGKIQWLRLSRSKSYVGYASTFAVGTELTAETANLLDAIRDASGNPYYLNCDIVFIVYAGMSISSMYTVPGSGTSPTFCVISEKTRGAGIPSEAWNLQDSTEYAEDVIQASAFGIFHEYMHASSGELFGFSNMLDHYGLDSVFDNTWIGLSGFDGSLPGRVLHLDPWAKLRMGWVDFAVLNTGLHPYYELPVIEQPYDDCAPHVAIIPINVPWSTQPDWMEGHYLIIENRRPVGFDSDVKLQNDQPYNTIPWTDGGFLVWEYDEDLWNGERGGLTLIEADGNYDMKHNQLHSSSADFFDESQVLSVWTNHALGTLDPSSMQPPSSNPQAGNATRTITIAFADYDAEEEETNTIPLIAIDLPHTNTYDATKFNNQRKIVCGPAGSALVETSWLGEDEEQALVLLHTSTNNGTAWRDTYIMNTPHLWESASYNPGTSTIASAPSVAFFSGTGDYFVTWQEQSPANGKFKIRGAFPGAPPMDISSTEYDCTAGELLPVVAYGYVDPMARTIARIVFATDQGLHECVSTDEGASWSTPTGITGTTSTSTRPSLAMSQGHEILAWRDYNSTTGVASIHYRIDGGNAIDLTGQIKDKLFDHATPCVDIAGNYAQIVWVAKIKEMDTEGNPKRHQKACHVMLDLSTGITSNVFQFFNRKYDRDEASEVPVVAATPASDNVKNAAIMWSVRDSDEGARLRWGSFELNSATGDQDWTKPDKESSLSGMKTMNPALAGMADDGLFAVVRGSARPYQIATRLLSDDGYPGQLKWDGEKDWEYIVTDGNGSSLSTLVVHQPVIVHPQAPDDVYDIAGVPASGTTSRSIRELSETQEMYLTKDDVILWNLDIHRDSINQNPDTLYLIARMYDVVTGQEIGNSGIIHVFPQKLDTAVVFGLELPPSHYPSATVKLDLEVQNGVFIAQNTVLSILLNNFAVSAVPKSGVRDEVARHSLPESSVEVSPQPARDAIQISYQASTDHTADIAFYDILGRRIHAVSSVATTAGLNVVNVTIPGVRPGVYTVVVTGDGQRQTAKLTIGRR